MGKYHLILRCHRNHTLCYLFTALINVDLLASNFVIAVKNHKNSVKEFVLKCTTVIDVLARFLLPKTWS